MLKKIRSASALVIFVCICLAGTASGFAHCDTLDGPVVKSAQAALENGDVTPVLKWIKPEHEQEVRVAFQETLAKRTQDKSADMRFFEVLVRIHRMGEGEEFMGLKPSGAQELPIVETDKALASGSVEKVVQMVTHEASAGIRSRFARVMEKKQHVNGSVAEGREYVEAYVELMHYVEGLYTSAEGHGRGHQ